MCNETRLPVWSLQEQGENIFNSLLHRSHCAAVQIKFKGMFCLLSFSFTDYSIHKKTKEKISWIKGHVVPVGVRTYGLSCRSFYWQAGIDFLGFTSHCNAIRVFQGLVCHRCWQLLFVYTWSKWHHCCFWWKMCNVQMYNPGLTDKGWIRMARNRGGQ